MANQWIKIVDGGEQPAHHEWVIVGDPGWSRVVVGWIKEVCGLAGSSVIWEDENYNSISPTYWMPMIPSPKDES